MKRWLSGLMVTVLMVGLPAISQAMPGAKVLITDRMGYGGSGKVIEVDPVTKNIVWDSGTITDRPQEAIPLTNGNIMIADTHNNRIIEVNQDKQIVWQWQEPNNIYFAPIDVKKTPQGTILVVEMDKKIMEIEYPAGNIVWTSGTISTVREVERLPGTGTPTYLVTQVYVPSTSTGRVMLMQRDGTVLWEKTGLRFPVDATQLVDNSILICELETSPQRVTKVDYDTKAILWEYGSSTLFNLSEAIQIENGHYLIVGNKIIEVDPLDNSIVWEYENDLGQFVDIEEKGIINIARIEYRDAGNKAMKPTFAGVVVPILQPVISSPLIAATKTVSPGGPQAPGATLTYTIVCTNTGQGTATDVNVIDQVPDGTKLIVSSVVFLNPPSGSYVMVSHDGGKTYDSFYTEPMTHVRWTMPVVTPGQSATVEFKVVIQP